MENLKLKFACGPYDRMERLRNGAVRPAGIDLECITIASPRELFDRMAIGREFDISEMSSSETIVSLCAGEREFVALPVFPSRVYRHGNIYVKRGSGVSAPKNLEGKRIGVPLYTMTAAIWIRGMLEDDFGVDFSGVQWVQGASNHAGSHGEARTLPSIPGLNIVAKREEKTLFEMLEDGEIDAFLGSGAPMRSGGGIVRLFPDHAEREKDYFRRTGIHPIMHLVAIRRDVFERSEWIARPLYESFVEAKNQCWAALHNPGASPSMFPWVAAHVAETEAIMGKDPWPYGVEANRAALTALVRYLHRQKLIDREPSIEELFIGV